MKNTVGAERVPLRFHHGGVSVPDLAASIEWYARALGFQVESRMEIPQIPAKGVMLRRGELRMELFEVPGAAPLPLERRQPNTDPHTHGNKHVAFAVSSIDALVEELRERDVDIVFIGRFDFGSNAFIRDNCGNLIEFVQDAAHSNAR
jgi:methylmalonyl-CoA/ethylmalonyl-CoA epimerase